MLQLQRLVAIVLGTGNAAQHIAVACRASQLLKGEARRDHLQSVARNIECWHHTMLGLCLQTKVVTIAIRHRDTAQYTGVIVKALDICIIPCGACPLN
jgi:hypothetical protein